MFVLKTFLGFLLCLLRSVFLLLFLRHHFYQQHLSSLQDSFVHLGNFDIIFCRNAAIYFSDTFKKDLFDRFAKALNTGGYFFIGASESLSFYSNIFKMLTSNRLVYYQVKKAE